MSASELFAAAKRAANALTGFALAITAPSTGALAATQISASTTNQISIIDAAIADAAHRFGIPAKWIRQVVALESGGDVMAISPKGALGLMQLMPATYAELRVTLGLSDDPFLITNNITAGAAYLRQLYDRFGVAGMFAAYNAGPGRYQVHVSQGRPLPTETQGYVRAIAARLSGEIHETNATAASVRRPNWRETPLFAVAANKRADAENSATVLPSDRQTSATGLEPPRSPAARTTSTPTVPHPLFVVIRP